MNERLFLFFTCFKFSTAKLASMLVFHAAISFTVEYIYTQSNCLNVNDDRDFCWFIDLFIGFVWMNHKIKQIWPGKRKDLSHFQSIFSQTRHESSNFLVYVDVRRCQISQVWRVYVFTWITLILVRISRLWWRIQWNFHFLENEMLGEYHHILWVSDSWVHWTCKVWQCPN